MGIWHQYKEYYKLLSQFGISVNKKKLLIS